MRFVLIDRFVDLEPGRRAVAIKTFSPDDVFLADHFPGFPVIPGVLLTEAMGQTAGWLLALALRETAWPLLTLVDRAKFHRFVRPGEEIRLQATVTSRREDDFDVRTDASIAGRRVAEARLLFHAFPMADLDLAPGDAERLAVWARSTLEDLGAMAVSGREA